jgi:hypothetical protein
MVLRKEQMVVEQGENVEGRTRRGKVPCDDHPTLSLALTIMVVYGGGTPLPSHLYLLSPLGG